MQPCLFLVCDTVCLLSSYTWKGEPAVLQEKGSGLTNGRPCFQGAGKILEQKKSTFSCGRQPTVELYRSWGDYKLNNVELDFLSEGHACL